MPSMPQAPAIRYLRDTNISQFEDRQIRKLLRTCFDGEDQACIEQRRFFHESPMHRFVIWNEQRDALLAHAAFHEKRLYTATRSFAIGAIAEVAIAPDSRGQGWVSQLMAAAEQKMAQLEIGHALLFGDQEVYGSSGYQATTRVHILSDRAETSGQWVPVNSMCKSLTSIAWPDCDLYLPGKPF